MTFISLNEDVVCCNPFDSNKVLGYVQAKNSIFKRNPFLEYIITTMLQYQNIPKMLEINVMDLYTLPFSSLKNIFDIIKKHNEEYKQAFEEKHKELENQINQIRQEFMKLTSDLQQK